jgi:DNA-binding NarL/FixJ family response regulator
MKSGEATIGRHVLLRVLIADTGSSTNDGLTALLSDFPGLSVFGCTQEPGKVLALVTALRPEVVILDLAADFTPGLKTLKQIKRLPHAPIVIALLPLDLEPLRTEAAAAGADYHLVKATECDRLLDLVCSLIREREKQSPTGAKSMSRSVTHP